MSLAAASSEHCSNSSLPQQEFTDFLVSFQKIVSEPDGAESEKNMFSWALAWSTKFNFDSRPFYKGLQILPNYSRGCERVKKLTQPPLPFKRQNAPRRQLYLAIMRKNTLGAINTEKVLFSLCRLHYFPVPSLKLFLYI